METNFTPWNDRLEIEGDAREEIATEGFANLKTAEEIAEYEEWLSDPDRIEAETEAIMAGYCPRCGENVQNLPKGYYHDCGILRKL